MEHPHLGLGSWNQILLGRSDFGDREMLEMVYVQRLEMAALHTCSSLKLAGLARGSSITSDPDLGMVEEKYEMTFIPANRPEPSDTTKQFHSRRSSECYLHSREGFDTLHHLESQKTTAMLLVSWYFQTR